VAEARAKLARKGCDWIVANNVAADPMGGAQNQVTIVTAAGAEAWERLPKEEIGRRLAERIALALAGVVDK
jgi:phosphopantothenoylcysteine decarboxylase/phosphopantothenate--cysteine ligase